MLQTTPEEFTTKVAAAGFEVEEEAVIDDTYYFLVRHPEHDGTELAVTVCEDEVVEVERHVVGGVEYELGADVDEEEFEELEFEQKQHLYNIDFGEFVDKTDDVTTFEELLAIFNEQITVRPTL